MNLAFITFLALLLVDIGIGLSVLLTDGMEASMRSGAADAATSPAQIEVGVRVAWVLLSVMGAGTVGVSLLFVFKMRAGRQWARIVLTVVAAFGLLSALTANGSDVMVVDGRIYDAHISPALLYAASALSLVAIVLLWRKPTGEYMAAQRIAKARKDLGF